MNSLAKRYFIVVPAAGVGCRMGSSMPKQYLPLLEKTVIEHALKPFLGDERVMGVVVVLSERDSIFEHLAVSRHGKVMIAVGGRERFHSVLSGLQAMEGMAAEDDWVLVHDAARPCLTADDLDKLMVEVGDHPVGGLLGVPVADSLKLVADEGSVERSMARDRLWRALTPQMFRYGILQQALLNVVANHLVVTDDAQAVEMAGYEAKMVLGRQDNLKITVPEDLLLAEHILKNIESASLERVE